MMVAVKIRIFLFASMLIIAGSVFFYTAHGVGASENLSLAGEDVLFFENVTIVRPDIEVSAINPDGPPVYNRAITVNVIIYNRGMANAQLVEVNLREWSSTIGTVLVSGLSPGETGTVSFIWRPSQEGEVILTATAECSEESNATLFDNSISRSVMVQPPGADMGALLIIAVIVVPLILVVIVISRRRKGETDEAEDIEEGYRELKEILYPEGAAEAGETTQGTLPSTGHLGDGYGDDKNTIWKRNGTPPNSFGLFENHIAPEQDAEGVESLIGLLVPSFIDSESMAEIMITMNNGTSRDVEDVVVDLTDLQYFFKLENTDGQGLIEIKLLRSGMQLERRIRIVPKEMRGAFPVVITLKANGEVVTKNYKIKVGGTEVY